MQNATLTPNVTKTTPAATGATLEIKDGKLVITTPTIHRASSSGKTVLLAQINWAEVLGQVNGKPLKAQFSAYVPAGTPVDPKVPSLKLTIPLEAEGKLSSTGKMMLLASGSGHLNIHYSGQPIKVSYNVGHKV